MLYRIERWNKTLRDEGIGRRRWIVVMQDMVHTRAMACLRRCEQRWPARIFRLVEYNAPAVERRFRLGFAKSRI